MNKPYIKYILTLAGALVFGSAIHTITKVNDSPLEQVAETVLRGHGIDIDFSPDDEDE
jgi:hypothetical protein